MKWINHKLFLKTIELILLVLSFLMIFGPMMSLVLWSVAQKWYWPHPLPQEITFDYWKQALGIQKSLAIGAVSIVPAFFLSLGIAVVTVLVAMALAVPAGYALAKYRIPFGTLVMFLFLMPNAFPQQPIFVNILQMFTRLGLAGTIPGVILVHILVGLVFGVWITSATFRSIPPSMEEAARSVGASPFTAFFRITLPLAAPGLLASSVFVFITSLDEFTGTFFIGLPFVNTLPLTLYSSSGYNMQFASVIALILLVPSILFMFLIQRVLKAEYVGGMG
ncbi:MAG TPA: ABC transporter permease subunit [Spirochaetales bacterium]|nr:ABC transporter permease subunit [Spirochaetales bacterium]